MKVLFIGNDASRTGAPIGLLCFLRWLKENTDIDFEILLRIGRGPLLKEYEALAPVMCYDRIDYNPTVVQRVTRRLGFRNIGGRSCLSEVERRFEKSGIDLIYANTVTHGGILADLARLRLPVIVYVHELEWGIQRYGRRNLALVRKHAQRFIAASMAVKQSMVGRRGFPTELVDVVYEMLPPGEPPTHQVAADVRSALKLKATDFVVGGCGFHGWRKGRDLFVDLARAVHVRQPGQTIHFVWVGGPIAEGTRIQPLPEGGEADLKSILHFVPEVDNPLDYFAAFDVFAMVSREDPYPMVNLECASLGKPVLCFAGSGGSAEFVGDDAGFTVPYLDIDAMAEKVLLLAQDRKRLERLGGRAAEKARAHDVSVIAPQLLEIIRRAGECLSPVR